LKLETVKPSQVTEIGERYYAQCVVILGEVASAAGVADKVRTMPRGKLRMTSPLNLAQAFLAPILRSFLRQYPDVELIMDVTNRTTASTGPDYDFMLHIGPGLESSTRVRASFRLDREILVASPALLLRAGTPQTPAALKSLPSAAGRARGRAARAGAA
jgi:DNA-binding transcriptional LysR family regulator